MSVNVSVSGTARIPRRCGMTLGSGGESSAAVAGRGIWGRAHGGMKIERDHARACGGIPGCRPCGWRWHHLHGRARHRSSGDGALLTDGKLWRGRDHGGGADVKRAEGAHGRSFYIGWRRHHRVRDPRRHASKARSQNHRRRRDGKLRPQRRILVRPGHDVGQSNIALQVDVGRSDDGLKTVVSLRRQ